MDNAPPLTYSPPVIVGPVVHENNNGGLVNVPSPQTIPTITNAPTPVSLAENPTSPLSVGPAPSPRTFNRLELELIHHYSTKTYMTMTSKLTAHLIWRDNIFEEALKNEFLLNALMASAALHKGMSFSESSEDYTKYTKIAFSYQNAALSGYIPALNQPSESNAIALFIGSALLSVWLFGSKKLPEALNTVQLTQSPHFFRKQAPTTSDEPTDFLEILALLQGINAVVAQTRHWLHGRICEVIMQPPPESDLPPNPPDIEESFNLLATKIETVRATSRNDTSTVSRYELYNERLRALRKVSRARTVLEWDQFIFSWPVTAEMGYVELVKQRDAIALALFIHWAACFKCLDHLWWAKGWAIRLVRDATPLLDRSWSEVISWPRKEVGLEYEDSL